MTCESDVRELLECLLLAAAGGELEDVGVMDSEQEDAVREARVRSFNDAGLLTNNEGIVLRLRNGAEFQLQIVQSKEARE